MNHSEEAVDKVLSALRNAEAPAGMELRILRELEHRDAIHTERRGRVGWLSLPGTRPLAFGVTFAGLIVVALIVPALSRLKQHPTASKHATTASLQPKQAIATSDAQASSAPQPRPSEKSKEHRAKKIHRENFTSLEAMHAQSQPAPPLPLTEQEKLLLRIAHRRDPQLMALLNAQLRLQEEKEERADFQNFFEPPASGENQ